MFLNAYPQGLNDSIEYDIKERLKEHFGVTVSGVDISAIEIDKTSDEYRHLLSVTRNLSAEVAKAQSDADIRDIYDRQRIESNNYEESLRIQREENQYAQHLQTQSQNISAFQTSQRTMVGIAGAEALGKMGENGAGGVNINGGNIGFNPATVMAGMAIGGSIGKNVANLMNDLMPELKKEHGR